MLRLSPKRVPHHALSTFRLLFLVLTRSSAKYSALPSNTSTLAHGSSTAFTFPGSESWVRCRYLIFTMRYGGVSPALLSSLTAFVVALIGTVVHT